MLVGSSHCTNITHHHLSPVRPSRTHSMLVSPELVDARGILPCEANCIRHLGRLSSFVVAPREEKEEIMVRPEQTKKTRWRYSGRFPSDSKQLTKNSKPKSTISSVSVKLWAHQGWTLQVRNQTLKRSKTEKLVDKDTSCEGIADIYCQASEVVDECLHSLGMRSRM